MRVTHKAAKEDRPAYGRIEPRLSLTEFKANNDLNDNFNSFNLIFHLAEHYPKQNILAQRILAFSFTVAEKNAGKVNANEEWFAKKYNSTHRSVTRAKAELRQLGFISKNIFIDRKKSSNNYFYVNWKAILQWYDSITYDKKKDIHD
jgi:hypothetical protein